MNSRNLSPKGIFSEACEIADPDELETFLRKACAGDLELRSRVEALLDASRRAGSFLDVPVGSVRGQIASGEAHVAEVPETRGQEIGPYRLLDPLGEGGFGVVFRAEQEAPVRRQVALKIIKAGMDTRAVIARFDAERQALALMDHPNIARVLDAGETDRGRPYFVMELVEGDPITRFCDEERLGVAERLRLFCEVCRAVEHAHQKG
ncbi:MAG: protein kinase, partial [Planctomycetota bacterium]